MATKLKGLEVTKVDFVDEGANPDAHIKLFKKRDKAESSNSSTSEATPKPESIWKRFINRIGKSVGMDQAEIDQTVEEIEKSGAKGFGEMMNERKSRKIADEIWDLCFALSDSLCSIMRDEELDASSAETAMQESINDFTEMVQGAIGQWSSGKVACIAKRSETVSNEQLEHMKNCRERLDKSIEKAVAEVDPGTTTEKDESKGDEEEMKIDKSKLNDAERAFLDAIEKKAGTEEVAPAQAPAAQPAATDADMLAAAVAKALTSLGISAQPVAAAPQTETEVAKNNATPNAEELTELEALRKYKQDAEDAKLHEVAKGYEILGHKEEDLFPVLKSLKDVSEDAYNNYVESLNKSKEAMSKSDMFTEIGKRGVAKGASGAGTAWAEAEVKATEIMKSKKVTKSQALDEVFQADPALAKRCEEEE